MTGAEPRLRRPAATVVRRPGPRAPQLGHLREAVQGCRACELYKGTTQAVFGEGLVKAEAMFVGEQPGRLERAVQHAAGRADERVPSRSSRSPGCSPTNIASL